jgi:hypothetical protein
MRVEPHWLGRMGREVFFGIRVRFVAFLSAVVAVVLLTAVGRSSVSVCLEQGKGVSASEDARSYQGCGPNPPASW